MSTQNHVYLCAMDYLATGEGRTVHLTLMPALDAFSALQEHFKRVSIFEQSSKDYFTPDIIVVNTGTHPDKARKILAEHVSDPDHILTHSPSIDFTLKFHYNHS